LSEGRARMMLLSTFSGVIATPSLTRRSHHDHYRTTETVDAQGNES
jgi:hypothetical protein